MHQARIYVIATSGRGVASASGQRSNPKTLILPTDCVSPVSKPSSKNSQTLVV